MHFTASFLALILPLLATSIPTNSSPSQDPPPFSIIAIAPGKPIQYAVLSASDSYFYLNKGKHAVFTADVTNPAHSSRTSKLELYASVPGGQQAFVIANKGPETPEVGALAYTPAHSHKIPEGAYQDGFEYGPAAEGNLFGVFGFEVKGGKKGEEDMLYACQNDKNKDVYQVFADVGSEFLKRDCMPFKAVTMKFEGQQPGQF